MINFEHNSLATINEENIHAYWPVLISQITLYYITL